MLAEAVRSLTRRGLLGTVRAASFAFRCAAAVKGKRGIEIGGPTKWFAKDVPVYRTASSVDNCVFSTETIWEGQREDGASYHYLPGRFGLNRVVDGVSLHGINEGEYEFVLSSHSLEHIANPIKAITNWKRVSNGGPLVLVLPYCHETLDHLRPVTALS